MPRQKAPQGWEARPAIVVDTREQLPYDFSSCGAEVVVRGLASGDYSLDGLEDRLSIERKNPQDFLMCVGRERERFERELERLWKIHNHPAGGFAAVVVEADLSEIASPNEHSLVYPQAAAASLVSWSVKWGFPFVACSDRRHATAWVLKAMEKFHDYAKNGRLRRPKVAFDGEEVVI